MVSFEAIATPASPIQAPMLCFHKNVCDCFHRRRLIRWIADQYRDDGTFVPRAFERIELLQADVIDISPQNPVCRACGFGDECRIGFTAQSIARKSWQEGRLAGERHARDRFHYLGEGERAVGEDIHVGPILRPIAPSLHR